MQYFVGVLHPFALSTGNYYIYVNTVDATTKHTALALCLPDWEGNPHLLCVVVEPDKSDHMDIPSFYVQGDRVETRQQYHRRGFNECARELGLECLMK